MGVIKSSALSLMASDAVTALFRVLLEQLCLPRRSGAWAPYRDASPAGTGLSPLRAAAATASVGLLRMLGSDGKRTRSGRRPRVHRGASRALRVRPVLAQRSSEWSLVPRCRGAVWFLFPPLSGTPDDFTDWGQVSANTWLFTPLPKVVFGSLLGSALPHNSDHFKMYSSLFSGFSFCNPAGCGLVIRNPGEEGCAGRRLSRAVKSRPEPHHSFIKHPPVALSWASSRVKPPLGCQDRRASGVTGYGTPLSRKQSD